MDNTKLDDVSKDIEVVKGMLQGLRTEMGHFEVYQILQKCGLENWLSCNSEHFKIIEGKEYSYFEILNLVSNIGCSYRHPDNMVAAFTLFSLSEQCPISINYTGLSFSVGNFLYTNLAVSTRELSLQSYFCDNVSMFIPNAKLVKLKCVGGNLPDAFVEVDGQVSPVEIKRDKINNAAIRQALRYKAAYKSDKVYVMAPVCEVKRLPDCVEFFALSLPTSSITIQQAKKRLIEMLAKPI